MKEKEQGKPKKRANSRRRLGKAKTAQGRHLYVTGECRTHAEVAEVIGAHVGSVSITAMVEKWSRLRDEHVGRVERRAIRESERTQSRAISRVTSKAWKVAELAIDSLHSRLKSGDLIPRPTEVEAITRTALALTGHHIDDGRELDELEQLSLLEIANRSLQRIEQGLGAA